MAESQEKSAFTEALEAVATAGAIAGRAVAALKQPPAGASASPPSDKEIQAVLDSWNECGRTIEALKAVRPAIQLDLARALDEQGPQTVGFFRRYAPDVVYVAALMLALLISAVPPLIRNWPEIESDAAYIAASASGGRALLAVGLVDVVLVFLLVVALFRCERRGLSAYLIPHRLTALLVLVLGCATFVTAFAQLNLVKGLTTHWQDSMYQALLTVTTFSDDAYKPYDLWSRSAVTLELLSVVLMLIVCFPLLVSRLAMFAGEAMLPGKTVITVSPDSEMSVSVSGNTFDGNNKLIFEVDELGEVVKK